MNKLKPLVGILSLVIPALLFLSFNDDLSVLQSILQKMQRFHSKNPQEKLYLHFDKPFYSAGEDMWFKAYLVEASMHSLDSQSRAMYVELIDATKTIQNRKMYHVENGQSFGDIHLSDSLPQGKYIIRAYTNYMKNAGDDFFFTKEFSILNRKTLLEETKTEEKKYSPDSVELIFFPEGGNMVACGTFNRLAFKALSPDGKSIEVEGEIRDESNAVVTTFKTQHDGMGLVKLNPTLGKKYTARILKPYQVNRLYELPRVHDKGYVLQVDEIGKNIKVVIFSNADKPASGKLDISIVAQSRGKVYHAQAGVITTNAFFTYIPRSKFPEGITQITIFDSAGRPLAERLIHQDQSESLLLDVKAEASYGKRSRVTIYTDIMYRDQTPAIGSFSVSVYDEGLIQNTEKYPLSITNYLSLTSDLKGHIENPGYYFKDEEPETKKNLDLLMMVNGWRRFTWKDILEERDMLTYRREHGIPISGTIKKELRDKAPLGGIVKIMSMRGNAVEIKPDSLGKFYSDDLLFYDTMKLILQTENKKGKKAPYKFELNPADPAPKINYAIADFSPFNAALYLNQQAEFNSAMKASEVKVLEVVDIRAKREFDSRLVGSKTDAVDVSKTSKYYTNIFEMIRDKVPALWLDGSPPTAAKYRNRPVTFLINGSLYPMETISIALPEDVEKLEVLRGGSASLYGGSTGSMLAVNIVLRQGWSTKTPTYGVNQVVYPGFYEAKEFYSPQYDIPDRRHDFPDKRTTLYWEPMIVTDSSGKIAISFFTADQASHYRVVMEGITPDGYAGTGTATFEVK